MKWLGFIILVLIESLAIFGLSLEQIGFTVPQAILISCYVVLLIITITVFIVAHFVNLQKERENEFRILVEKLRVQEEAIKTIKEAVIPDRVTSGGKSTLYRCPWLPYDKKKGSMT